MSGAFHKACGMKMPCNGCLAGSLDFATRLGGIGVWSKPNVSRQPSPHLCRHSGESRSPQQRSVPLKRPHWIAAFAAMTGGVIWLVYRNGPYKKSKLPARRVLWHENALQGPSGGQFVLLKTASQRCLEKTARCKACAGVAIASVPIGGRLSKSLSPVTS